MSLINKMLQDLDARGSQGAVPLQDEVRPVTRERARLPLPVLLVGAVSAVSLAVGGYFALRFYEQRRMAAPLVQVVTAPVPAPVAVQGPPPVPVLAPAAVPAPVPVEEVADPEIVPHADLPKPVSKAPILKARERQTVLAPPRQPAAARAPAPVLDTRGRADSEYRRALGALAEGRVSDSIGMLEGALRVEPRHDGARQTLVGLLVENKRHDEAMGHLQAALAVDPRQPSLAMLLARMQIERGGDGIETLMRTLPAAGGQPEYHAFLAGALGRVQRNGEAAEQYGAALRKSPNNAVWLMGLGVALQDDGRNAEALEAFQRARSTGALSAELGAFVERKINQLGR